MTSTSGSDNGTTPPAIPPPAGDGEGNVGTINIADEMRASYRDYSMSVIIGRALPDVRDGLKPVHRRILYAMYDEGLLSNRKYSKCAGVVGEVLKKYHPHGDSAVYDALVRMAQPWNMGAPLIDGQGNFGSVDGDPAAAYRYTEARLQKLAEELLRDIERNTVDFIPNFDGTQAEPAVLPSRVPNLIVNGSEGIAVAMATRCPPHNLGETVDALLAIIDEQFNDGPKIDVAALMNIMQGPDFPTGGIICGRKGIYDAFATGRGSIKVRGRASIVDNEKSKRTQIIIEEIPYQVNKSKLVERMAELVREKRIEGIAAIRDESDRTGMRIAIDLRKDAIGEIVLNQLYKHTALQNTFPTHQLAIVDGQPRTMPMRDLLENFIDFRREIVTRRTRYELDEAQKRFHLVAGLLVALDDIDRIISIIRSSKTSAEAKQRLCAEKFENSTKIGLFASAPTPQIGTWLEQGYAQLDAIQAQAILDMRLSKLVGLERDKLEEEGGELLETIDRLKGILGDLRTLMNVIIAELKDVRDRFSVDRRTAVQDAIDEISVEDLIVDEEMVVTISHQGYIKRSPLAGYRAQRRGGKGRSAAKTKDEDFIEDAFVASTHDTLMIFTDMGKVYWLKVHQVPKAGPQARGRPIVNLIQLDKDENVRSVLRVREYTNAEGERYLLFCSRKGKVKKTDLVQYRKARSVGLIACGIDEGDALIDVKLVDPDSDVMLSTRSGRCVRFKETDARTMGRSAAGVKGIGLKPRDEVVSMLVTVADADVSVLSVTERGYGKRTELSEFPTQKRGGQGVIGLKTTDKVGEVAAAILVGEKDELMITTDGGTLIRVAAADVSQYGRNTQGVRILNTGADEKVMAATRIADDGKEADAEGGDGAKKADASDEGDAAPENNASTSSATSAADEGDKDA